MAKIDPKRGMGSLVIHTGEHDNAFNAHISPIFQTSTFTFPDVATGAAVFKGEEPGYIYTRYHNPNSDQLAAKIAVLEGLDLLRAAPDKPMEEVVAGMTFSSGMAAVTSAILARVKSGDTVIAMEALYSASYAFLHEMAPCYGVNVVWLQNPSLEQWEAAFKAHPNATLAYAESPANPTMAVVDLAAVAEIAHRYGAWVMVDNTFASPYCQRPLTLGCDVVVHSTTKYICGHGLIIGGAVVSRHPDFVNGPLYTTLKILGGNSSPFDSWLASIGLKTFELRMQRHCDNAMQVAQFLDDHPAVAKVFYPGLPCHPDYAIAKKQMHAFGGMITFELKGGLKAGEAMMNHVHLATLAVSLGNVDTLIQHPASMTHSAVSREDREHAGITDGMVRLSVGVEDVEDIIADLDQAMKYT
ncbi:MAG TPA: aminotransferase class I/II-fold pyridoxal phosphate-dependent enzyme [Longilinea sp.]|nr:aminotransferase class I/II-fold pyridoxal phosphate-dependent enzyme [Longilinea sp.]